MLKITAISFILLINFLFAQDIKPATTEIRHEVLDEQIDTGQKEQSLNIQITSLVSSGVKTLAVGFENISARWSLISARLNGETLWLVKAAVHPGNEKVLAWEYNPDAGQIELYPYNWTAPYVLDLEMQLNPENKMENQQEETIVLEAELSGGRFQSTPTGRGGKIKIR